MRSHRILAQEALRYLDDTGEAAALITAAAPLDKKREGAVRNVPVYFGGADNAEPAADKVIMPPPCGYLLTPEQFATVKGTLALLGARVKMAGDGSAYVPMAQAAEPVIPLLLDGRGTRHSVAATPVQDC